MTYPFHKGLRGGKKQMWLRVNRDLVMRYCEQFGAEDTCEHFNMQRETLDKLYKQKNKEVPFTKADRAMALAEIAKAASLETKKEVKLLRKDFSEFQDNVARQVAKKVLVPWIQAAVKVSEELEHQDKLDGKKDDFKRL